MFSGLTKTRKNMEELEQLFKDFKPDSNDFYDELEELLLLSELLRPSSLVLQLLLRIYLLIFF